MTLKSDENTLNEVAIVGFGTQKKISMVSAVTTINPKDLKGPTSNLTQMLAGRLAGVIGYQSGENLVRIMPLSLLGDLDHLEREKLIL